jgi:hypothetical protein
MEDYNKQISDLIESNPQTNSLTFYKALYDIHFNARKDGAAITYPATDPRAGSGFENKVLEITVFGDSASDTSNWKRKSIPITPSTDFNGWTFKVSTSQLTEDRYLFYLAQDESTIQNLTGENVVRRESIDNGDFRDHLILKSGKYLLLIEDETPWTYRQDLVTSLPTPWSNWNYNNPNKREDVLLIIDGIALNRPIAPYSTMQSSPSCRYVVLDNKKRVMKNVNMVRTANCEKIVNLVTVKLLDDVTIENVVVTTPNNSNLTYDACINLLNATNITVKNFSMNKTYCVEAPGSLDYGYGIQMVNVWNSKFIQVTSNNSVWGFFGCRHVNTAYLEKCEINRFDIHYYGRDITCVDCKFAPNPVTFNSTIFCNNRFSSLFGNLIYEGCTFDNFIPYFTDYNYNLYQGFDVVFKNCTFLVKKVSNARLIELGYWGEPLNCRQEHIRKGAPNVAMEGCTIKLYNGITEVHLFYFRDQQDFNEPVHHVSYLSIDNLTLKDGSNNVLPFSYFKETNKTVTYVQRVFRFKDKAQVNSF